MKDKDLNSLILYIKYLYYYILNIIWCIQNIRSVLFGIFDYFQDLML